MLHPAFPRHRCYQGGDNGVVVPRHCREEMVLDLVVEVPGEPVVERPALNVARGVDLQLMAHHARAETAAKFPGILTPSPASWSF